jgi:TonB family protein
MPNLADRTGVAKLRRIRARGALAAGCALAAHVLVLGLVLRLGTETSAPALEPKGIPLFFMAPASTFANATPQQVSRADLVPAPTPAITPAPLAAPAPLRLAAAAPTALRPDRASRPAQVRDTHQLAQAGAPGAASPPHTGQSPPTDGQAMARLEASIDDAVRRQAAMPPAAIRQRREGRAQLRFSYLDGAVAEIAVAQSSQSRLLDDAALQAVRAAHYPAPPASLRGRRLALQVWINFRLASSPG